MLDLLRGFSTLLVFVSFLLLCFDVYRKSKKSYYEEAALLPFRELEDTSHMSDTSPATCADKKKGEQYITQRKSKGAL